ADSAPLDTAAGRHPSHTLGGTGGCDLSPDQYCVTLAVPGLLPALALRGTFGVWILSRLAVALSARFQFNAGEGTLANLLLGARAQVQLTTPAPTGLNASAFVGTSVGQIQLQPPQDGAEEPFIISGLNGVQVGGVIGYRLMPNFGFHLSPELHFLFPTFLFAVDLTAGIELAF
ncbi:MAG: hypothetical protein OEY14_04190, partial [Myxococcales bacterium]|nr:hypothetical protein [Myxococcales bacterium]